MNAEEKQIIELEVKIKIVPEMLTDIRKILGFLGWVLRRINPKQEQRLVDKIYASIVELFEFLEAGRK